MTVAAAGSSMGVVELFSGIDSLYLSGATNASPVALTSDLADIRSRAPGGTTNALLDLGAAVFEVASNGFGKYRYRLDHANGILGVTESEHLPTFRVQIRGSFLHAVGPAAAVRWWNDVLSSVATGVRLTASRLDVCADFHGLDFEPHERENFVCSSGSRDEYTRGGFTGWTWGAPGAMQRARAYDKLADAQNKGLDWVRDLWGSRYQEGRSVWRVEAQCKRQVLLEYGVDTATSAIALAPGIYRSVFTNFLTLRLPGPDTNRSRWPLDERWIDVAEPSFATGVVGIDRVRQGQRAATLRGVLPQLVGNLASAAAALDLGLPDVCGPALIDPVVGYGHSSRKSFEQRRAEKARRMERAS